MINLKFLDGNDMKFLKERHPDIRFKLVEKKIVMPLILGKQSKQLKHDILKRLEEI